jgi:diaminopimelate epimerase
VSARIALTKMHGAGNDFVIFDARANPNEDFSALALAVCDRRTGIGADGLIAIGPSGEANVAMRTFNPDGSEAEMCGNGIRCAARWLEEGGEGTGVAFETGAGIVRTEMVARDPEYLVSATMPVPRIVRRFVQGSSDAVIVDSGNPHLVLFPDPGDDVDLGVLGPRLQSDPHFPGGVNVHSAVVEDPHRIRVRHWERGAGATQACGTGAVAAVVAAIARGTVASPVDVFVPGGKLVVEIDGDGAKLVGPAVRVFDTLFER